MPLSVILSAVNPGVISGELREYGVVSIHAPARGATPMPNYGVVLVNDMIVPPALANVESIYKPK